MNKEEITRDDIIKRVDMYIATRYKGRVEVTLNILEVVDLIHDTLIADRIIRGA